MAVFTIKDRDEDWQAKVSEDGYLYVTSAGGGGLSNVNIFDSSGNPLTSTGGALNVNSGGGIGWANFGQSTPNQVSVTDTSTPLLMANALRLYASFTNNSSSSIYLQYKIDAVWKQGEVLRPNQTFTITTIELFLGQVNAITDLGAPAVLIDVKEGIL